MTFSVSRPDVIFGRGKPESQRKHQHLVTALGIDEMGCKAILGSHQRASEDQIACDGLFSDLAARGLKVRQLHLNIIDCSQAVRAGLRRYCGESSRILRCQLHKRRNIVRHFPALTRTVVQFVFLLAPAGGFCSARGCENFKKNCSVVAKPHRAGVTTADISFVCECGIVRSMGVRPEPCQDVFRGKKHHRASVNE